MPWLGRSPPSRGESRQCAEGMYQMVREQEGETGKVKQRIEMDKVGGKVEFNRIILIGRPGPLVLFFFRGVLFTNSYMIPLLIAI